MWKWGPKNSRMPAPYDSMVYEREVEFIKETTTEEGNRFIPAPLEDIYQHTYIGGYLESDVYHFFPVLIHDNVATISLHHRVLEYGKRYYVEIDPEVFTSYNFV